MIDDDDGSLSPVGHGFNDCIGHTMDAEELRSVLKDVASSSRKTTGQSSGWTSSEDEADEEGPIPKLPNMKPIDPNRPSYRPRPGRVSLLCPSTVPSGDRLIWTHPTGRREKAFGGFLSLRPPSAVVMVAGGCQLSLPR
ncbi:hypothetical protein F3Y22_tig00111330pilonHSYRG01031 [Hibiscus syriacus]|uniref:Uncharacterized protein n=1 Tax=Hibiscus syriacus TaxID=106335 RepID=A0A6A2YQ34_HIBSY|nr:hypothetical protein F3Y22_tig00111330pilonHSYRG01031 [Hibiscus syriacus]